MKKDRGILIVISGFAGSGKGTIVKMLTERYDNYVVSVSATTRNSRPGEVDGKDYFFVTREKFEKMIAENDLLEHAEYVGNYYGTPRKFVNEQLMAGKDVILEIEYLGAFNVKKQFPEAVLVFLCPPSAQEVYRRLKKRGTETEEVIKKRLVRGKEETEIIEKYDFLICNDDLEECIEEVNTTLQSAKNLSFVNEDFINSLKTSFDEILSE